MDGENVKGNGLFGGFLSRILGNRAKETIEVIGETIDKIDKSDEKLELQLRFKSLLVEMESKYLDYENKILDSQTRVIESEAKGESWLQRNWRPMLMLICMFIVLNNYVLVPYFGLPVTVLDERIWKLMELGVGGYVAGRSLEKISENLGPVLTKPRRKR